MRRKTISIVLSLALGTSLLSSCAYFRPSKTEAEYLREQQISREQEQYKHTCAGALMNAGAQALDSAVPR